MKSIKLAAIALPILAMVSCVKAPIVGRADTYTSDQVNFVDEDLRDHTAIGRIKLSTDESGLLHVDVPVRATTDLQLYVDYRVSFVDQNGISLGAPTGWITQTLPPNTFSDILVNSSSPRARDFHMDLRYAK